ncbi:MAG: HAD-IIB family hydrolase [Pseudomonadota bacterium]|uniref:HAD-IIB family hydrolase n=1 Tax=Gallaecimonas pentaromativorans TaxID=584787 RepID=UPI00067E8293|nr:HAD-IIB family hydrolase [Gallaecimonas pentaromativorans]MED5523243.1 HAD-IIB family hydrolase [Pseudomonadota bacterium]
MPEWVVVTDLDGTLLDHHNYSWAPAQPALDRLAELGIPVVLNSSKTRSEIRELQSQLGLSGPFIAENGAILDWGDGQVEGFAEPRQHLLTVLGQLRQQGFAFEGFADWSAQQIAAKTGLSHHGALLAGDREFTEPLEWQGDESSKWAFEQALAGHQLQAQQGGRFFTVMGQYSKAAAFDALRRHYPGARLIALGDSPNDGPMLDAADIAVVIQSARSDQLHPKGPTIRTTAPGPSGWNQAIQDILNHRS